MRRLDRPYRPRGWWRSRPWWPFVLLGMCVLAAGLALFLVLRFVVPWIGGLFQSDIGENVLPLQSASPVVDLSDKSREVLLTGNNRSIGDPAILGDEIFFPGGMDGTGKTLVAVNVHNIMTKETTRVEGIQAKNDGILSLDVNAQYIVYFDSKDAGGGNIYAYNRETQAVKELMRVPYGWPQVRVCGGFAVWMERTGNVTEKLYLMDIETLELTTLAVFSDSPFGLSAPGVGGGEVVWAEPDPDRTEDSALGVLKMLPLDGSRTAPETYFPEMFVYSPVTNGRARAWMDSSLADGAGLYLSVEGNRPKKIAEGVQGFGLGENFLAFTQGGVVWAYFFRTDTLCRVSPVGEYCFLGDVGEHGLAWFNITDEVRERDILKYAVLD